MSQKIKEAFNRVKQDMRRLQNQIDIIRENQEAIREEIEAFREREDELYQVQEQAERIAELQEGLDKYNEEQWAPQPGFEPGTPVRELAFEASAIPDYATEAQHSSIHSLFKIMCSTKSL